MNTKATILSTLIIASLLIGSLATGALLLTSPISKGPDSETASVYILGPARKLLAEGLYQRADTYFHRGAQATKTEAFQSIFQKWSKQIHPNPHAHASGNETAEILPWLRLATHSDPENIEIYLTTSYWLNMDCKRPDLALQAIEEAIEKNPDRYELPMERARINLSVSDYETALKDMEIALGLISRPNQTDPVQAAIDKPFILMALSFLYESEGKEEKAIDATSTYLSLRENSFFKARLENLKAGNSAPSAAQARLHEMFHKEHQCDRDEHEEGCGCPDHDEHVHGPECNH